MPSLTTEDLDQIEREEGGRGLRQRLEDTLAELTVANKERSSLKAAKVIQDNGLTLVTEQDLAGVSVDELEAKAVAVQAEKAEAQKALARSVFEQKGLEGSELDAAVEDFLKPAEGAVEQAAGAAGQTPPPNYGKIPGQPPSDPRQVPVDANASGLDLLRAAEEQSQKSKR